MDTALILVVEDEPAIAEILCAYLERAGYRTVTAADGDVALNHHQMLKPDLVLLDIRLPRRDGHEVLAEIRRRGNTPVIMATASGEDLDRLLSLNLGADDHVAKPFNPLEVVARVKAVLRRSRPVETVRMLRAGPLEVDLERHEARVTQAQGSARRLDLTLSEFRLLARLAGTPARVFSRADLLDSSLPDSEALERTVDSHISNLRRKLAAVGAPSLIVAVRGVGYRLAGGEGE